MTKQEKEYIKKIYLKLNECIQHSCNNHISACKETDRKFWIGSQEAYRHAQQMVNDFMDKFKIY